MPLAHSPRKTQDNKDDQSSQSSPRNAGNTGNSPKTQKQQTNVRRSIGEWETSTAVPKPSTSTVGPSLPGAPLTSQTAPLKQRPKAAPLAQRRTSSGVAGDSPSKNVDKPNLPDRVREGRAMLIKAKTCLSESRNLKSDLKAGITQAVERLYQLLKDQAAVIATDTGTTVCVTTDTDGLGQDGREILKLMRVQVEKLDRTQAEIEKIKINLETHHTTSATYAQAVAAQPRRPTYERSSLHSIVITSKNSDHSGEDVMSEVRKAVNAKDGWVTVERVRKLKDKKVIIGCRTEEERNKVKERLKSVDDRLVVEEMKNQDPMLTLKDVLNINSDEDVVKALRSQNGDVFQFLDKKDDRVAVKFKRRARNPLTNHVTVRVSPQIYNRMLAKGAVHIDMQRVRVVDQSPLVQCSMCLAYGHGRRFCVDTTPKCSHCGGPHMKNQCADFLAAAPPSCCNCAAAKMDSAGHNAFGSDCPVRKRWDALARAKVAYC